MLGREGAPWYVWVSQNHTCHKGATGVIEGACHHLVKDRMDITGARWGLRSAEAALKLRSLHSSGDTEAYCAFHKACRER